MNWRQLLIVMIMGVAPTLALAEPLQAEPLQAEAPQVSFLGAPVSESALSQYRGARDITFNLQNTEGQLYNNQATNTISGGNQVSDQAFSGSNGISTVIQNSGNNVLIQNSTIVNVKMQYVSIIMRAHLLVVTLLICLAGTARAGSVLVPAMGGINVTHIESVRERAFSRTVHQQFDFSCGSAAVATLLTYQYNEPISEHGVFKNMWDHGDQEKIRQDGFSLLDIKRYLDSRGYQSNGYEVPLDKLMENSVPAIMLISDHGYNHFVVVKGLSKDRVLLGDPSAGARVMSRERFQKILVTPIVFVITNRRQQAIFNGRTDWRTEPLAPLGTAMSAARLAQETVFASPRPGVF